MKRRALLVSVLALVVIATTARAAEKIEISAVDRVITVDGDDTDWKGLPLEYMEDSVRVVGISHDEENLYLMWRFADERLAQLIARRGVVIWLDGNGKKKKTVGLRYAGSAAMVEELRANADERREEILAERDEGQGYGSGDPGAAGGGRGMPGVPARQAGVIEVITEKRTETVKESDPDGPTASSTASDGLFCYELSVPLETIGGAVADGLGTKGRKLSLGVEIGGLSEEEREAMKERMAGMRSGMHGGMGGGGRGGGGRGGMGGGMGGPGGGRGAPPDGNMRKMLQGETVWRKLVLIADSAVPN